MFAMLSKEKQQNMLHCLSYFLLLTMILTSLFTFFRYVDGFTSFMDAPDHIRPQANIITEIDYYPLHTSERFIAKTNGSSGFLLGHYRRLPLRLPVAPIFFLNGVLFYLSLLQCHKKENQRIRPDIVDVSFTIRYIHDQNGETYHSFLF